MNVVGKVALVEVVGGRIERWRVTAPILVKRFPFGWQSLDLATDACHFYYAGISDRDAVLLSRGIPVVTYQGRCRAKTVDAGPAAEVAAVRYRMRRPFVPYVIVSGSFSKGEWYGAGGGETFFKHGNEWLRIGDGETFFKRTGDDWLRIGGGGGAMSTDELRRIGVPNTAIRAFCMYGSMRHDRHVSCSSSRVARSSRRRR
ncbi:MAG: hypothetical protein M3R30_10780 [Candidatus Eremiobacteraeota bacterium]|nr:hypothetical protein [Candidatus Eremiobacteraeota bacterium]